MKGDVKFAEVLEKMGAKVTWTENSVTVTGPPQESFRKKHLRAIDVNMNKMPDVAMTLAVVALFADGPTAIRDGLFLYPHLFPLLFSFCTLPHCLPPIFSLKICDLSWENIA